MDTPETLSGVLLLGYGVLASAIAVLWRQQVKWHLTTLQGLNECEKDRADLHEEVGRLHADANAKDRRIERLEREIERINLTNKNDQ